MEELALYSILPWSVVFKSVLFCLWKKNLYKRFNLGHRCRTHSKYDKMDPDDPRTAE